VRFTTEQKDALKAVACAMTLLLEYGDDKDRYKTLYAQAEAIGGEVVSKYGLDDCEEDAEADAVTMQLEIAAEAEARIVSAIADVRRVFRLEGGAA
jgi:hypothetical protein